MPTKAEREAEAAREQALKEGRFAAAESDDNAVAVSEEGYVGVSPEYRNHAYDTEAPLKSEDGDAVKLEEAAKANEIEREKESAKVGHRGYEPNTPHPSEAKTPATDTIERNRAIVEGQAAQAAATTSGDGGSGDGGEGKDGDTPPSPLGG